jgi:hypothetical protein
MARLTPPTGLEWPAHTEEAAPPSWAPLYTPLTKASWRLGSLTCGESPTAPRQPWPGSFANTPLHCTKNSVTRAFGLSDGARRGLRTRAGRESGASALHGGPRPGPERLVEPHRRQGDHAPGAVVPQPAVYPALHSRELLAPRLLPVRTWRSRWTGVVQMGQASMPPRLPVGCDARGGTRVPV